MVSFQNLLSADLSPLHEAIAKWRNLPGQFQQTRTNFQTQVQRPLTHSDWEGGAADAAAKKFTVVTRQMSRAVEEARDVHRVLDDAYKVFKRCKKQLKHYKEMAESDAHLHIDSAGKVTYKPSNLDKLSPQHQTAQAKSYSEAVAEYNRQINTILDRATKADEALEWALRTDTNGRAKGFNHEGSSSLKEAERGRKQAAEDARKAVDLASIKTRDLTLDELKKVNSLLRKHEGDDYFAEKFSTGMGPRDTLDFWQRNANRTQTGGERTKTLSAIQKSLGRTLATASHSDSPAMKRWKHDIIKLGSERFTEPHSGPGYDGKGPYGFQIMSSLMRGGEFDKDFLVEYGKGYGSGDKHVPGLLEFDRKASKKGDLEDFWTGDGTSRPMLDLGKGHKSLDPMSGYLEALGHNPEASQEVFHKKGYEFSGEDHPESNKDLRYLLKERDWPKSELGLGDGPGYRELGHALEAAALGHPHDQPEAGLHRTPGATNVMSQVVNLVAGDSTLVEDHEGIGRSLGKMGAGYIEYLNRGVTSFGGSSYNAEDADNAFRTHEKLLVLKRSSAANFLTHVGADEDGYKILSSAQHELTTNIVRAHGTPDEPLKVALGTGAETHGILDASRTHGVLDEADDKKSEQAQKLSEAGEWRKYRAGQGAGLANTLISAPLESSRVGGFLVPLVEMATGGAETQQGIEIDREIEEKQEEFDSKVDKDSDNLRSKFRENGERSAQAPLDTYMRTHEKDVTGKWRFDISEAVKNGYDRGYGHR
ncbi:DUF6571 family protein [Streptomyces sp. NPDC005438]|uniref:DUF6571 family protein n=1 Tax=Streptomyces sp. NPDC005438 TaxID=3156880 RepID=UPI0033BDC7A0